MTERRTRTGRRCEWPRNPNITRLESPCREWFGTRTAKGYGYFGRDGKTVRVHRWIWEQVYGPIPVGHIVMHRCDNPACYRLDHLSLGTPADNMIDMQRKGRSGRSTSRLGFPQVEAIRVAFASGARPKDLAQQYGLSSLAIYDMLRGRTWADAPGPIVRRVVRSRA